MKNERRTIDVVEVVICAIAVVCALDLDDGIFQGMGHWVELFLSSNAVSVLLLVTTAVLVVVRSKMSAFAAILAVATAAPLAIFVVSPVARDILHRASGGICKHDPCWGGAGFFGHGFTSAILLACLMAIVLLETLRWQQMRSAKSTNR